MNNLLILTKYVFLFIAALFLIYVVARIISAAIYKSKYEACNHNLNCNMMRRSNGS